MHVPRIDSAARQRLPMCLPPPPPSFKKERKPSSFQARLSDENRRFGKSRRVSRIIRRRSFQNSANASSRISDAHVRARVRQRTREKAKFDPGAESRRRDKDSGFKSCELADVSVSRRRYFPRSCVHARTIGYLLRRAQNPMTRPQRKRLLRPEFSSARGDGSKKFHGTSVGGT